MDPLLNFQILKQKFILGKDMVKDTCFEFEKKRNEPLVYNRDLYVDTIQAMKRIEEIKDTRE
jgi:large subunit ribosomal protein L24e